MSDTALATPTPTAPRPVPPEEILRRIALSGRPYDWLRSTIKRDPDERFWEKVDASGDCWEWTAAIREDGYGVFVPKPRTMVRAHRYAWESLVGPIPEGMVLDHLCRNRRCVNPDHLRVVTNAENLRTGYGITALHSRKSHCVHGHPLSGDNLRLLPNGGRECVTCRRRRNRAADAKRPSANVRMAMRRGERGVA